MPINSVVYTPGQYFDFRQNSGTFGWLDSAQLAKATAVYVSFGLEKGNAG